jgi:hypothetical protein
VKKTKRTKNVGMKLLEIVEILRGVRNIGKEFWQRNIIDLYCINELSMQKYFLWLINGNGSK